MKTEAEAMRALDLYADTIRRICFIHLKNQADTEDVFQEVFLKYILCERLFESDAHEKAWLIRVAVNQCRDAIYLCYYEGYTAAETARLLQKRENTVYTWLTRGKKHLREQLGGDFIDV